MSFCRALICRFVSLFAVVFLCSSSLVRFTRTSLLIAHMCACASCRLSSLIVLSLGLGFAPNLFCPFCFICFFFCVCLNNNNITTITHQFTRKGRTPGIHTHLGFANIAMGAFFFCVFFVFVCSFFLLLFCCCFDLGCRTKQIWSSQLRTLHSCARLYAIHQCMFFVVFYV